MTRPIILAAAAAAATLLAAAPAAAVTLTFRVELDPTMTETGGAAAGLTPAQLTFEETWSFTPALSTTPADLGGFVPPGFVTYNWRGSDLVGTDDSGVMGQALGVAGLAGDPAFYSNGNFKNRRGFDDNGDLNFTASEFSLDQGYHDFSQDPGTGDHVFASATRYIFGAEGNYLASSLYDTAMLEFLTGRTLDYWVSGSVERYSSDFSNVLQNDFFRVSGTATLIGWSGLTADPQGGPTGHEDFNPTTAVPEPATWALLIGGFALAGATLRRRRPATA